MVYLGTHLITPEGAVWQAKIPDPKDDEASGRSLLGCPPKITSCDVKWRNRIKGATVC